MAKLIDLHVHSTSSDGTLTPAEVVRHAKSKGLAAIALTDHDTVAGVHEAIEEGNRVGLEVIPGVELSAEYEDREIHILGLNIDFKSTLLLDKLHIMKKDREERDPKMINKLNELGFEITLEDVKAEAVEGGVVTRAHFAAALLKKGYISERKEAFEEYIGFGCPAFVKRAKVQPVEAIKIIKDAGGVAVVAHICLSLKSTEKVKTSVKEFMGCGLEGIEVFHSDHSKEEIQFLQRLAKKNNLLVTGGSDFHGLNKNGIDIGVGFGQLVIRYELLERIKAKNEGDCHRQ